MVPDIVEGQRRREGSPKMTNIHHGVNPDIFKHAQVAADWTDPSSSTFPSRERKVAGHAEQL